MSKKDEIRLGQMDRIPSSQRNIYSRAFSGSKANAVKAKCLDCCCGVREEVRLCEVYMCPLYEVRPYREKVK